MPLLKSTTVNFLRTQLQLSETKITLLKTLKTDTRPANLAETTYILGETQRTNSEIIALALEHEYQTHQALGINYQPFLLESDKQKDLFADFLAGMPIGKEYRFNLIIGGRGLHATPVVIDSDGAQVRIFSLDAALYYDNFNCIDMFTHATNAKTYKYTGGGIQNSAFGCTIYSIGHLREMAKMNANELESMFYNAMSRSEDQYIGLNPEFVTNMQSIGGMERYLTAHPEAHIAREAKEQNAVKVFDGKAIKLRNYSITYQNEQVLNYASEILQSITEDQFQTIFEKRTGKQALEQAYEGLTAQQISRVDGIYNIDKIKLALEYDFFHDQIFGKDTRCFGPRKIDSITAANVIRTFDREEDSHLQIMQRCSGPQLELLMRNKSIVESLPRVEAGGWQGKQYLFDLQVLEAYKRETSFEQIKDCTNAYAIEAISKYNIEPELANTAICFQDPKNQAIAISFMRRAFDEAEDGKKESMVQTVFSRIRDNPCAVNHEVAALYKEAIKTCLSPASITYDWQDTVATKRTAPRPMALEF